MKKITRKFLVEKLKGLLSNEFDPNQVVYMTNEELIEAIIHSAEWYQNEYNNIDNLNN
jgi:hypothetical protein